MDAGHTPGPWHWESDVVKGDPFGRIRYQVTSLGKTVTRVYYSSFEGGPTNAEADARLIAAAPELLSALIECLSHDPNNGFPTCCVSAELRRKMKSAVEKAIGNKP